MKMKAYYTGEVYKKHETDAGFDLFVKRIEKVDDNIYKVYTGVRIAPENGFWCMLIPRSSLHKKGYMLANNIGVIDNEYRGEIIAILYKFDKTKPDLEKDERFAQIIFIKQENVEMIKVDEKEFEEKHLNTERGEGGFGSTGKK